MEKKIIIIFYKLLYDYSKNNYNEIVSEISFAYYPGKIIELDNNLPLIEKKGEFEVEFE